jgi:hypothetical protein
MANDAKNAQLGKGRCGRRWRYGAGEDYGAGVFFRDEVFL